MQDDRGAVGGDAFTTLTHARLPQQVLRLVEELEDHDDVQSVSSNFDISEEEIASFSQGG